MSESSTANSSHRLRTALLEMEEQVKGLLKFMEGQNDSFDNEGDRSSKRAELTLIFDELKRSYSSLSNYFKSDSIYTPASSTSSSKDADHHKNYAQIFDNSNLKASTYDESQSVAPNDNSSKKTNQDPKSLHDEIDYVLSGDFHCDSAWRVQEYAFRKLVDENLLKQEELIRRNNRKSETISKLKSQLRRLTEENKDLRGCIIATKVGGNHKQSYTSRLKGVVLGKLLCRSSVA